MLMSPSLGWCSHACEFLTEGDTKTGGDPTLVMGRYTEKPNLYRIFGQTETDVGIQQTENTEKPTEKTDNIGYFGIH